MDTIKINDKTYVRVDDTAHAYVLIRSQNAGVHVGRLYERVGDVVTLVDSRRIWYWKGVENPEECKFSVAVPTVAILCGCNTN